ncbi:hypothetical protein WL57_16275 [Burkholderia cepacia]|nr:hypothetical protein WL57_16275 [Burkholderia cepacia]
MPRKPKAQPAALPAIPAELLEQFGNGPMTAEAINAATLALKKALIERMRQDFAGDFDASVRVKKGMQIVWRSI